MSQGLQITADVDLLAKVGLHLCHLCHSPAFCNHRECADEAA